MAKCPFCSYRTVWYWDMASHIYCSHPKAVHAYKCPACDEVVMPDQEAEMFMEMSNHLKTCEAFRELQVLALLNR